MNSKIILGIVAEYDPFHNGHAYHLTESRKAVHPDAVYIALSPCLKQRGTLSLLSPYDRAACAVHEGADAVFYLPVLWSVRSAEDYALGAVSLLTGLGITHLAFGAETADLALLEKTAALLENPPARMTDMLHALLSEGFGFPAALSRAASVCLPEAERILSCPNNILAVCYLKAIRSLRAEILPVVIPRKGHYHSDVIHSDAPSASALRASLMRGVYGPVLSALPSFSASLIRKRFLESRIPSSGTWDMLALEAIRNADPSVSPDNAEGLAASLQKAAVSCSGLPDIRDQLTTRRYSASRISRLCAMTALGVSLRRLETLPLPSCTLLLGLRKKTALTDGWKDLPVRIFPTASAWADAADPEDLMSWKLWSLCCGQPDTLPFTEKVFTE